MIMASLSSYESQYPKECVGRAIFCMQSGGQQDCPLPALEFGTKDIIRNGGAIHYCGNQKPYQDGNSHAC